MLNINITPKRRFLLAILWSVSTILLCYFFLFLGLTFLGRGEVADLITGEFYTLTPLSMAIVFIIIFKTDELNWNKFRNPGLKWLVFGFLYTLLVLFLTIITDYLLGQLQWNPNYSPLTTALPGFTTHIQILDMILYVVVVGSLLIFQPGGFDRIVGEEAGWRGYLLPELLKLHPRLSIIFTTLIVGLVWFTYHLPYFSILAVQYNIIAPDKVIFTIIGALGVFLGANWAMTWAYLKTRSIWPALMLHYSWNLIAPILTGNIYDGSLGLLNPSISNLWLMNGEGLIGGSFHFLVGLVFLFLIIRDRDKLFSSYKKEEAMNKMENDYYKRKGKGLPKRMKINE